MRRWRQKGISAAFCSAAEWQKAVAENHVLALACFVSLRYANVHQINFKFAWHAFQCSASCGGGIQTRTAVCKDTKNRVFDESECERNEREVTRACADDVACPDWVASSFTPVRDLWPVVNAVCRVNLLEFLRFQMKVDFGKKKKTHWWKGGCAAEAFQKCSKTFLWMAVSASS